jgi:hypothetical protein
VNVLPHSGQLSVAGAAAFRTVGGVAMGLPCWSCVGLTWAW